MTNIIVAGIILIRVGSAMAYIIKEKKKGVQCIGCSHAGACAAARSGQCACHSDMKYEN